MSRALILLDLDNVQRPPAGAVVAREDAIRGGREPAEAVVAVVACNTEKLAQFRDWDSFRAAVQAWVQTVEPVATSVTIEPLLAPAIPERADEILVKAVGRTGVPEGAGPVDWIWILTGDRGLTEALRHRIQSGSPRAGQLRAHPTLRVKDQQTVRFLPSVVAEPLLTRKLEASPTWLSESPQVPAPHWTVRISSPSAAWFAEQRPQFTGSPFDVARACELDPAVMTQAAPTRAGGVVHLAAVRRLAQLAAGSGPAILGEGGCEEGLCYARRQDATWPPALAQRISIQSGGPGAVSLLWKDPNEGPQALLARTKLPFVVVKGCSPVLSSVARRLDDAQTLKSFQPAGELLTVTLTDERKGIQCTTGSGLWWWSEGSTTGKIHLTGRYFPLHMRPQRMDVSAVPVLWQQRLLLEAPVADGEEVVIETPLPKRTLALARTQAGHRIAVLSPRAEAAGKVRVRPVRLLSRTALKRLHTSPDELRALPIAVVLSDEAGEQRPVNAGTPGGRP